MYTPAGARRVHRFAEFRGLPSEEVASPNRQSHRPRKDESRKSSGGHRCESSAPSLVTVPCHAVLNVP